ncbi:hypothetical protein Lac2_13900 [Claveliimonas bilis]|uniref:UvrD-helicase domain-containing protein n=1 Tax=Clostridia TaxID=186801 RepID=UPI00110606E7|nr:MULTISPECIES: UvrD-helicase domain-containing protein [Clostridia]BDZ83256.1 hypothetical protein Lac2_13900 [Claveliimonas bilis]
MSSLIVAAAGAGKTTFLVKKALEIAENVLITTYTDANEQSIRDKFYEINGCIPPNVTIMPWFSLLIRHGIRPYQSYLINNRVSGVLLVNKADRKLLKLKDTNEKKYVTASGNVYSNMISKLPCVLDRLSNGCVFRRMRKIFSYVFVDEIQDFAGYDLEIIRKLHEVGCNMTLVGDPRQTTYRTHYETKYKKYAGGKIVNFVQENIPEMNIDSTTLAISYRNNQIICDLANRMYPDMKPCDSAMNKTTGHDGIFWINEKDIDNYMETYNPVQLRYDKRTKVNEKFRVTTFGSAKGLTFDRVLIYPTQPMLNWLSGKSRDMKAESLSRFYVAVTRAKYSVGFVYKTKKIPSENIGEKWTPG